MRRIRALLAACVPPIVLVAAANCGDGETTLQDYAGQAGSDASAGTGGASAGAAGQAAASGQDAASGQAGAAEAGSAGQAGASGGAAGDAGSAGATSNGGAAGNGDGGAAGTAGAAGNGGSNTPCTSDAQCPAGTSCQITPNDAATALELRCRPLAGANGSGYPCTDNSQCRAGLCLAGYCSNPCLSIAECTQAGSCSDQTIQVGALSGTFKVCLVEPCTASTDCDPGEVCSDIKTTATQADAFCRQEQSTGAPLGGACQQGSDCVSQLCPGRLLTCTEVCGADVDCAGSPGAICADQYAGGTERIQVCAPGCSRLSDCPADKTCAPANDTPGDRIRFACQVPWGADAAGADCSQQVNCASGICLSNYLNGQIQDSICTQPCVTAADCPAGLTSCVDLQMPTPSGQGTQIVRACNH